MFDTHKRVDWTVIVLGLIALAIIGSFVFFVLYVARQSSVPADSLREDIAQDADDTGYPVVATPEEIQKEYQSAIESLVDSMSSFEKVSILGVEETLFSVRVPQEKLDMHLSVSIDVRGIRENGGTLDNRDTRDRVRELVASLLEV